MVLESCNHNYNTYLLAITLYICTYLSFIKIGRYNLSCIAHLLSTVKITNDFLFRIIVYVYVDNYYK